MAFLHRFLPHAARRVVSDPRTREKAAELFEKEVKPRAEEAWRKTKPKIEEAKAEFRNLAAETDPRKEPARFAGRLARRIIDRVKGE